MDRPRAHGTFEYLVSNPDLKPEVAWSANLGLEKRWHAVPLWGSVNLFESRVSDMIITVDTGREINGLPVRTYDRWALPTTLNARHAIFRQGKS